MPIGADEDCLFVQTSVSSWEQGPTIVYMLKRDQMQAHIRADGKSNMDPQETQKFTGAHEKGELLHPDL